MSKKQIFWGVLFIILGLLVLLANLGAIHFAVLEIWKYAPLLLIIWGLSIIIKQEPVKKALLVITALFIAFALYSAYYSVHSFVSGRNISWSKSITHADQKFFEPWDKKIKYGKFVFQAGAGKFLMMDSDSGLVNIYSKGSRNDYDLVSNIVDNSADVTFNMRNRHIEFSDNDEKHEIGIGLNKTPIWDLRYDIGAATAYFDISPYKVENVELNTGAASVRIKLGDLNDQTNLSVDAGAASIEILIPKTSGCEIISKDALTSKSFEGFSEMSDNHYQTENFDKANKKIFIKFNTGVSSLKVNRY